MPFTYNTWTNLENVSKDNMNYAFDNALQELTAYFPLPDNIAGLDPRIGCICSGFGSIINNFGQISTSNQFTYTYGIFGFPYKIPLTVADPHQLACTYGDVTAGTTPSITVSGVGTQYVCAELSVGANTSYMTTVYATIMTSTQTLAQISASNGLMIPLFTLSGSGVGPYTVGVDSHCAVNYGDVINGNNIPTSFVKSLNSETGILSLTSSGSIVITEPTGTSINLEVNPEYGGVTAGFIASFAGLLSGNPTGWLLCNGASYSATGIYANLATALTNGSSYIYGGTFGVNFLTPNINGNGAFIRGNGGASAGLGPNPQADQFQGHIHIIYACGTASQQWGTSGNGKWVLQGATCSDPINDGTYGDPRYGYETRPINFAMNCCIKY